MKTKDKNSKCDACGLYHPELLQRDQSDFLLCPICTSNHASEPKFDQIVCSMALGYFIIKLKINDIEEAFSKAEELVQELPYWKERKNQTLFKNDLNKIKIILTLSNKMNMLKDIETIVEPPDFFISHRWHRNCDNELVHPLTNIMKERGYKIWYDKDMWGTEAGKKED